jgi:hypothetical protein
MDHIIMADDREEIEIRDKLLVWTWTLPQLFQQPESEVAISAIDWLRTKIAGKFDADILIQELEKISKEAKALAQESILSHLIFTSPGAMIGGTIVCMVILFCCWRTCTRKDQAPLPYPLAPSAPTVFNMTVDPIRRWSSDNTLFSILCTVRFKQLSYFWQTPQRTGVIYDNEIT